jgi:hypothetical protein
LTTIAAYLCSAPALTFHGICVSVLFDAARGAADTAAPSRIGCDSNPLVKASWIIAAAAAVGGLAADVYKFQQHMY